MRCDVVAAVGGEAILFAPDVRRAANLTAQIGSEVACGRSNLRGMARIGDNACVVGGTSPLDKCKFLLLVRQVSRALL
jgi:hypothetical protein